MCGICGIVQLDAAPVDPELVGDMLEMIRHRGPDACGLHVDGEAGMGHVRLSILDLVGGTQPMGNADGSLWITFNGEIYNYLELRAELESKGRRFRTHSDTEVLLQLYEQEGEDCVQRLNGQWAFAIWDQRRKSLFLARDRLGVRPLFYCADARKFLFASEIKALFAHPEVKRELDLQGLREVFTLWHTIAPRTLFADIRELPPGHSLRLQHGQVKCWAYWHPHYPLQHQSPPAAVREEAYVEALGQLLTDAVRVRLRSDVPVGAYVSGGLDSSLIAALIRASTPASFDTFSIVFDDPEYDESAYQQLVAAHLGTRHHAVRCSYDALSDAFPAVVWHGEKALLRTAPAPMYLLSQLVRSCGLKVVLTGEGADEILGGYDIFKEAKIRSFWAAQPDSRTRPQLLRRLYPYMPQLHAQPVEVLKIFFHVRSQDLLHPFFSHLPRWEMTRNLELLFSREVTAHWEAAPPWQVLASQLPRDYAGWGTFRRAQYLETAYLLPGYLLSSQGDRVAMAHAVEGRFPFLDPRVVEFASQVPSTLMMRGLREKHLLRQFARRLLPPAILHRRKQPYRSPDVDTFLREGRAHFRHAYAAELLDPAQIRATGIFHEQAVQRLLQRLRTQGGAPSTRDSMALTGIVSTQLLVHQFLQHFDRRRGHGTGSAAAAAVHLR